MVERPGAAIALSHGSNWFFCSRSVRTGMCISARNTKAKSSSGGAARTNSITNSQKPPIYVRLHAVLR